MNKKKAFAIYIYIYLKILWHYGKSGIHIGIESDMQCELPLGLWIFVLFSKINYNLVKQQITN